MPSAFRSTESPSATEVNRGGAAGLTVMTKLLVALKGSEPSSVAFTWMTLVDAAWLIVGRHVNRTLPGPSGVSVAFAGADSRLNVRVCAGTSASLATLVTRTVTPGFTVCGFTGEKVGAVLEFICPANVTMLVG